MDTNSKLVVLNTEKGLIVKPIDEIAEAMKSDRIIELFNALNVGTIEADITTGTDVRDIAAESSKELSENSKALDEVHDILESYAETFLHTKMIADVYSKKFHKKIKRALDNYIDNRYATVRFCGYDFEMRIKDISVLDKLFRWMFIAFITKLLAGLTGTLNTPLLRYMSMFIVAMLIYYTIKAVYNLFEIMKT